MLDYNAKTMSHSRSFNLICQIRLVHDEASNSCVRNSSLCWVLLAPAAAAPQRASSHWIQLWRKAARLASSPPRLQGRLLQPTLLPPQLLLQLLTPQLLLLLLLLLQLLPPQLVLLLTWPSQLQPPWQATRLLPRLRFLPLLTSATTRRRPAGNTRATVPGRVASATSPRYQKMIVRPPVKSSSD
jgi:hypothetical protein